MKIHGYLSEFALPDLLRFLEHRQLTGMVSIHVDDQSDTNAPKNYFLWLGQGRVVAASHQLQGKGLFALICQQGWLSDRVAAKLAQLFPGKTPIGVYLKAHGVLHTDQLQLLFYQQVMRRVQDLCQIESGQFQFDTCNALPMLEMTGLAMPPSELVLNDFPSHPPEELSLDSTAQRDLSIPRNPKSKLPIPKHWPNCAVSA